MRYGITAAAPCEAARGAPVSMIGTQALIFEVMVDAASSRGAVTAEYREDVVNRVSDAIYIDRTRDRRWLILGVIGLAQLMVVLDVTVMNIALPSAQRALHFTIADRQWVVTAYTLAFGSDAGVEQPVGDVVQNRCVFDEGASVSGTGALPNGPGVRQ